MRNKMRINNMKPITALDGCFLVNCSTWKVIAIALTLLAACFLVSCRLLMDQYHVTHRNVGVVELDNVHVSYGDFRSVCGVLPSGIEKTHALVEEEERIPEEALVEWVRVTDGKKFQKVVKVKSLMPKGKLRGDVVFLLDDDDVKVTWENWSDWDD